jgi:hypothetical protein
VPRVRPGAYRVTLSLNGVEQSHDFLVEDVVSAARVTAAPR